MLFELSLTQPETVFAAGESFGASQKMVKLFFEDDIEEAPALKNSIKHIEEARKIAEHSSKAPRSVTVVATAYSSNVDETDSDPCTTANGFNVCKNNSENVIAANFLPFGTRVQIPELYGDRTFTVHDRMNSRYGRGRIDIWMKTKNSARQFGVKRTRMEIIDEELAVNL